MYLAEAIDSWGMCPPTQQWVGPDLTLGTLLSTQVWSISRRPYINVTRAPLLMLADPRVRGSGAAETKVGSC